MTKTIQVTKSEFDGFINSLDEHPKMKDNRINSFGIKILRGKDTEV